MKLYLVIKRLIDIILSLLGLIILSPIFLVLIISIKLDSKGPVLFKQKRVKIHKNHFNILKFRTMRIDTPNDVPTHMLENPDQWITKTGKFLRKTSLDELPQIINILKGDMSIIGPRPALWNQYDLIAERDKYSANDVPVGLTGWAQINGRDELSIEVKAKLDGEYAEKISVSMDAKIFIGSLTVLLGDRSIVEGGGKRNKEITKKKVLFLSNHFKTLFWFRKELIKKLVEDGYEVIISFPEDENNFFSNMGCNIVITDVDRRGMNPKNDLKLILFYKKIIPRINPDIILSYTIKPNIYGSIASGKKYKQICNITGTGAIFLKENMVAKICKMLYKVSIRKCYKVYFQNIGDKDFFVKNKLVTNNYEILPGSGCNLEEHKFKSMPKDDITRFIFIARVMKLKGINEYLAAAKTIKKEYSNTEFIIAGWNEEKEFKKIITEYHNQGIVNYIGFRNDLDDWISKCHCTILPSHGGEGIPNVLLESAANGRACIGSNINGITDVIDDGVTGFLFDTGSSSSLIKQIKKFLNLSMEEKAKMGKAARDKIESEFDRNIVVNIYCNEIEKA
jgi:galacturonosyltransferase